MAYPLTPNITDEQLARLVTSGNNGALGKLYERYNKKVYCKCLSMVKEEESALDITHDIFLKVFHKMASFKGQASFSTWLFAVTRNHCIEYLRKKQNNHWQPLPEDFDCLDETADMEERNKQESIQEQALGLLEQLDEKEKAMLLLKYQYNTSIQELQKQFGLSASAVKMRLLRARQKVVDMADIDSTFVTGHNSRVA